MKIMPALLDTSIDTFYEELEHLTPYFKHFQIDVADGIFVPGETLTLDRIVSVLPDFDNIVVDFHLMVEDWNKCLDIIEAVDDITIRYVLIHSKTNPPPEVFTEVPENYRLGMVINPEEEIRTIVQKYDLFHIPAIQIMTVIPGKQGQPFISDSLIKIEQLRDAGYKSDIFIDGAVNMKTLPTILGKKFTPDYAGIGSFLTKSKDLEKAITQLDSMDNLQRV